MDVRLYQKAKRYAAKIKYVYPIDLVHDLYLKWYEKTGKDLFDEPEGRVMSMVWKECANSIRASQWMFMGKRYDKIYLEFSEGHRINVEYDDGPAHRFNPITPLDYLVGKELSQRFANVVDKVDPKTRKILQHKFVGYNTKEISEEIGISVDAINVRIRKVNLDGIKDI